MDMQGDLFRNIDDKSFVENECVVIPFEKSNYYHIRNGTDVGFALIASRKK